MLSVRFVKPNLKKRQNTKFMQKLYTKSFHLHFVSYVKFQGHASFHLGQLTTKNELTENQHILTFLKHKISVSPFIVLNFTHGNTKAY